MKRLICGLAAIAAAGGVGAPYAFASFALKSQDVTFTDGAGSPSMQAGSHAFGWTTSLAVNSVPDPEAGGDEIPDGGAAKDVVVDFPPGLIANVSGLPRCASRSFLEIAGSENKCPNSTAIGVSEVMAATKPITPGTEQFQKVPVYNLAPPPGVAAELGFVVVDVPVVIQAGVRSTPPYNAYARAANISQGALFFASRLTVWGDPASSEHDKERGDCAPLVSGSCPVNIAEKAFFTLPRSCSGPQFSTFTVDSWSDPGNWLVSTAQTHDGAEPAGPLGFIGCSKLGFNPTIGAQPTTSSASSPTGLQFNLDVKDEGLTSPTGMAQSDIKKVVVALPEGMTANPALAEGLSACSEADLARETIDAAPGEGCPEESKIGSVEVETPLLEKTLKGSLFLATPYANPFGSLLGLYVVIKDPETGILIKLPGKVVPNETTGQLVSVFDNLPQLPFSHFSLKFREGQRSPLTTPDLCGTYTTHAELTPWADPEKVLQDTSSFQVTTGVAGGPCPAGGVPPFNPGVIAGTINNQAAAYSPLDVRVTRNDAEQEITGFASLLPPGVTANLTGVPFCTEAQIAAAKVKSGAQEEADPSCPVASQIGHTLVGVGVGSVLAYTPGKLYMAGPFQGAPFSVVAITSAKVGPFDLGTVAVHLPLNIDPITARVSIPAGAADQIPHILDGIVIHVRDIRVYVDRPNFTLNPTNCEALAFSATVYGSGQSSANPADDVPASVTDRFQAANCARLAFKPSFNVSTSGKTSRANGASLNVKLAYPKDAFGKDSNIRSVKVSLPRQLPSRLSTLQKACPDSVFEINPAACPAVSRVGQATAATPILPVPLTGPAYFVSHGGAKFPELIIVLQGYGVTIDLHGETFISKAGITSSTFRTVPDQPVTSFQLTLPQGPGSALAANGNLCTAKLKIPTVFTAQSGAVIKQNTTIGVTSCPKHKAKRATHRGKTRKNAASQSRRH